MEEIITYQADKDMIFELMTTGLKIAKDGLMGGAYAFAMFETIICAEELSAYEEMGLRIAGFLYEILQGEVTDEAEAWGTYWIYRYLNEPDLRKEVPDPEVLDEDIRTILSKFDVRFKDLKIYQEGGIVSI